MSEFEYLYNGLEHRKAQIAIAEGKGLVMLSDTFSPDWKEGDEPRGTMIFTDTPPISPPPEPPHSPHTSTLVSVDVTKARPAKVKRVWNGQDYFFDCFVTQTVADEYVAGNIHVGDYLLVHFDDMGEQLVTAKVFKSW